MPVLRTPFCALVEPGKPLELSSSGAPFKLFISSITSKKRQGEAAKDGTPGAYTTLYVKLESVGKAFAVASVDSTSLDTSRCRVAVPVLKHTGKVEIFVRGPDAVHLVGDQHTILTREQIDALGSRKA